MYLLAIVSFLHVPKCKKSLENYLGQSLKGNAKPGMSTEFENASVIIEEMFLKHSECRMFCAPYVFHFWSFFT